MADVSGGGRSVSPPEDAADRAQLLLVAGLVIAVTLVVLALTLNTVIYTENLATRSSDVAGGDDSIRFLDASEDAVAEIVARANRDHNESHAALRANVSVDVDAWRNATGRSYATNGVVTNLSNRGLINGTRMLQTDGSRKFTDAAGTSTWTLADDVSGTRQFRINATNASLANSTQTTLESDEVFYVQLNGASAAWEVYVYKDLLASTINVTVKNATSGVKRTPCSTGGDYAAVNVTAGTVGGESCPALSFASDLGSSYAITYNDTETGVGDPTITGTYHLIVDDGSVARSPGASFNDGPGNSPWADPAIYAVEYDAVYETGRLRYSASVRVAPGETNG